MHSIICRYLEPLYRLSEVIAELDVLTGFAVFISTAKGTYVRPHILPGGRELRVSGLRHPCVEKEDNVYFIPNNLTLKRDLEEFILITGKKPAEQIKHLSFFLQFVE